MCADIVSGYTVMDERYKHHVESVVESVCQIGLLSMAKEWNLLTCNK